MKYNLLHLTCLLGLLLLACLPTQAQNLALGKTATASSASQPAARAIDGDGNTRWESASSDNQQITVDLGTVQPIDRVRLSWENAYGKDFTIQVSSDNMAWTTVATVTGNATTYSDFTGLATSGRYVKMAGTARATSYGYSLYEFEVFRTSPNPANNLALGKTAVASSDQGGFEPAKAFDANNTSRWGSTYNDNQWLYVDLGRSTNITQVNLIWEIAYGRNFHLDVSNDATNWTTITTVTNNTSHVNEIALTTTGRYVRMFGVTRGTGYGFSLYEMQVVGSYVAPLPVELTVFQATAAGAAVNLSWSTASEKNSLGFEVQRSANGEAFTKLAWVEGAGTSQVARSYSYRDAAPLSAVSYYRLKQVDADGAASYSPVQTVTRTVSTAITAYPNPTASQATIAWPATDAMATRWVLTNALGQQIGAAALAAPASFSLDLSRYQVGTYYLTVVAGERVLGRTKVQKVQ
ncbi:discoidin domain-containing protein [Hymenobacter negativus]|uniref:Discoidin domain-containing protein n=1 Tax=Hymenobacter negativus TaxID=2795026 RepID=A0ABS3Q9F2_9BACT|nr:discoidin domain-containing protein [Hymenobacter negativus]MBO2007464.1 discoidin domain-containing protein [Hymenobacter negativus]